MLAEEIALGEDTNTSGVAPTGRNGISLFRLYEHATRALPQVSRNAPYETQGHYLSLYLGLARQQMVSNMDDARRGRTHTHTHTHTRTHAHTCRVHSHAHARAYHA